MKEYPTKDGTVIRHEDDGSKKYIHPEKQTEKGTKQVTYGKPAPKPAGTDDKKKR